MATTGTLLSVLSNIPWGKVVENAPKLADGAARLWGRGKKSGEAPTEAAAEAPAASPDSAPEASLADVMVQLAGQVDALTAQVEALQGQLLASSAQVRALDAQQAELAETVTRQRLGLRRLAWVAGAAGTALLLAVVALGVVLSRQG